LCRPSTAPPSPQRTLGSISPPPRPRYWHEMDASVRWHDGVMR
jgi:hypothetical protein